jgi:diadenosine tetraphosphate (Ap4A) HIT family hydrolase
VGRHSSDAGLGVDWRIDRIGSARRGENPMVLARMRSGWAVIGDTQFLGTAGASTTHRPALPAWAEFLADMALLGEAMIDACTGLDPSFRRINYEILGNTDQYLHAHLFPRYNWEPPELLKHAVSRGYPLDRWTSPRDAYGEEHEPLREAITARLTEILAGAY